MRWMAAGAYTMRHWRGVLLSIWIGTLAAFGLIAWWGYQNRDGGFGAFVFTLFGFIVLAMLIRFPRRLFRSMRGPQRSQPDQPGGPDFRGRDGGVIDTDAEVRDRPRPDAPPLEPRNPTEP